MTRIPTIVMLALLGALALAPLVPVASAQRTCAVAYDCIGNAYAIGDERPAEFALTTAGRTRSVDEPSPCVATGATVWASFTARTGGVARLSVESSTDDFQVAAFEGDAGQQTHAELMAVGCRSHYAGSKVEFHLRIDCVAGRTYFLQLGTFQRDASAQLRLTGCGETGIEPRVRAASYALVAHESLVVQDYCTTRFCVEGSRAEVDFSAEVDRAVLEGAPAGDIDAEVDLVASDVALPGGHVSLSLGGTDKRPPPPPPPSCGAGCGPPAFVSYALLVAQYAIDERERVAQAQYHP